MASLTFLNGLGKQRIFDLRWRPKMGCDIHDFVEIKVDDKWQMLGEVFEIYDKRPSKHPYDGRNYTLFGLLAGVRNTDVVPISDAKGVPSDASLDYMEEYKQWDCDGHHHSYLTLKEILDYPLWDIEVPAQGFAGPEGYKEFLLNLHFPRKFAYKDGLSIEISNKEMEEYIAAPDLFLQENIISLLYAKKIQQSKFTNTGQSQDLIQKHIDDIKQTGIYPDISLTTKIEWFETVRNWADGHFWNYTIAKMKELAPDGDYDRIRLVFFFDN